MVSVAPYFEGVADEVLRLLDGRIFVAHNERFDWGMIRRELLAAGRGVPELDRLCTVRLGRLVLPRLRSYGLDSLASHFRIRVEPRHRAFGDALATARVLVHLLSRAEERGISDLASLQLALGPRPRHHRRSPRRDGREA